MAVQALLFESPEDDYVHRCSLNGPHYFYALNEIQEQFRNLRKYLNFEEISDLQKTLIAIKTIAEEVLKDYPVQ